MMSWKNDAMSLKRLPIQQIFDNFRYYLSIFLKGNILLSYETLKSTI